MTSSELLSLHQLKVGGKIEYVLRDILKHVYNLYNRRISRNRMKLMADRSKSKLRSQLDPLGLCNTQFSHFRPCIVINTSSQNNRSDICSKHSEY